MGADASYVQMERAPAVEPSSKPGLLQRRATSHVTASRSSEFMESRFGRDFTQIPSRPERLAIQTKLVVNSAGDRFEQEADRIADQVTTPGESTRTGQIPRVQKFSAASTHANSVAPESVNKTLAESGRPMDSSLARDMGQRFNQDFSNVRVHSGEKAEQSARDVNARAYTVGRNIVFGAGSFTPDTLDGQRLIAHELTHVLQQNDQTPVIQRWAACSEANVTGQDCPPREPQEAQRARAGMVFFSGMRDPDTGRTGALIANFDIGRSQVKPNLSKTIHWQQFLKLMGKEKSRWSLVGFSDCHEASEGGNTLGADRAMAVFEAIPSGLRSQINKAEAAPSGACMRPNVTAADRTMNRSVAAVLDVSTVDFSDEESDVIVGKTPQDHLRDCQAGERVKTFPFRTTRFGGAPIMAHRDGDGIIVKMPMHVLWNDDFKKETSTLPGDTFIKGTRLEKDEIVRVRHYEPPHWYSMNITGDATGDDKKDYCVPAEKMLDFASATNKALALNMVLTGVDALTMGTPVGKWVGAGVSKVTAPLVNVAKSGLQKTAVATMLSLGKAAPTAIGVRETASLVEGRIADQAVTRAVAPAIAAPVAEKVETSALQSAVPKVGGSLAADVLPAAGSMGASEVSGNVVKRAVDDFVPKEPAPSGAQASSQTLAEERQLIEETVHNPNAIREVDSEFAKKGYDYELEIAAKDGKKVVYRRRMSDGTWCRFASPAWCGHALGPEADRAIASLPRVPRPSASGKPTERYVKEFLGDEYQSQVRYFEGKPIKKTQYGMSITDYSKGGKRAIAVEVKNIDIELNLARNFRDLKDQVGKYLSNLEKPEQLRQWLFLDIRGQQLSKPLGEIAEIVKHETGNVFDQVFFITGSEYEVIVF
jgi:hypothetical protein